MFGTIFPVNDLILDKRNGKQLELLIFFHFSYLKKKYKLAALKVAQAEALLEMLVMRRETVGKPVIYIYTRYRAANMNDDAASAQDSFMDVTPRRTRSTAKSNGLRFRRRGNNVS